MYSLAVHKLWIFRVRALGIHPHFILKIQSMLIQTSIFVINWQLKIVILLVGIWIRYPRQLWPSVGSPSYIHIKSTEVTRFFASNLLFSFGFRIFQTLKRCQQQQKGIWSTEYIVYESLVKIMYTLKPSWRRMKSDGKVNFRACSYCTYFDELTMGRTSWRF